jgi:putative hydrolase of the HAD superfamily
MQAVMFDFGGTLFGYERREQLSAPFVTALRRFGLDPEDPRVVEARQQAGNEIERRYAKRQWFVHRDLFRDRLARTAELLGVPVCTEVLDRFDDEQRQAFIEHLVPDPAVVEVLVELRNRGLGLAIVSNADDDYLGEILRVHGIDERVDMWLSSESARSCKPHRGIFDAALDRCGVAAREVVFVGDSLAHDIAGAARVGMATILIEAAPGPAPLSGDLDTDHRPDLIVRRLSEVPVAVAQLTHEPPLT